MAENRNFKFKEGLVGNLDSCLVQIDGYRQTKRPVIGRDLLTPGEKMWSVEDYYVCLVLDTNAVNDVTISSYRSKLVTFRKDYFESNFKDLGQSARVLFGQNKR